MKMHIQLVENKYTRHQLIYKQVEHEGKWHQITKNCALSLSVLQ